MSCKEYLVTLNIPPSLEEMMVDSLLLLETEHGFSSFPVNAPVSYTHLTLPTNREV